MDFKINKFKEIAKDYIGYLLLALVILVLSYFGYFFYKNIYLTVNEKVPLEDIVIKEKINIDLYHEIQDNLKDKRSATVNTTSWKDLFKG